MLRKSGIRLLLLSFIICVATCYPIADNVATDTDTGLRDEKTFPNGTVMGKYSYTDKEGNPIHVKYYADDQGYGVELKSVKFIKNDLKTSSQNKLENPEQLPKFEPTAEMYKYPKYLKKSVSRHQIDSLNKESPKNHLKNKYKGIDYEIYLQTVMPSQNCGHDEKVKIYNLEKDVDKKIRNVLNAIEVEKEPEDDTGIETPKFCELY